MGLSASDREVNFQQDLYFQLRTLIEEEPEISGVRFDDVKMEFPVDGGRADIVVFDSNHKAFLVIETKKKGPRVSPEIDPLSFTVIKQALGYATLLGSPYIATGNSEFFASFVVPQQEQFSIERHRVLITQIPAVNKQFAKNVLASVARYHTASWEQKTKFRTGLDWTFIIRLRSFVWWLSRHVQPSIAQRLREDSDFRERVRLFEIEKNVRLTEQHLARQMSYIFMNRILFYKILERHYKSLPRMHAIGAPTIESYLRTLNEFFEKAMAETKDFEAVFYSGIYDEISFRNDPADSSDIMEVTNEFVEDMEKYRIEEIGVDVIGYVYEELLSPEERHAFGQFYTPPQVAELIAGWAIRSRSDLVLEPAVGSGTFAVKAYSRLKSLKASERRESSENLHRDLLSQIFAVDINPFPLHLTSMNLAMRNVKHPVSEMNVVQEDFFKLGSGQTVFAPYSIHKPSGQIRREFTIPEVNAVIANPPYTRWTELTESARSTITSAVSRVLSQYKMMPGSVRSEPNTYTHFVIHGIDFLKKDGRLGMIISNSWLQADYGVNFGNFILDNFKVAGIIDFSARIFSVPLVSTLVILLEREPDDKARNSNRCVFMYIEDKADADARTVLAALAKPAKYQERFLVNVFEQRELKGGEKWIDVLFGSGRLINKLTNTLGTVAKDSFDVTTGNSEWSFWAIEHGSRTNIGSKRFFYLTADDVETKGFKEFSHPALTSVRYAKNYTFNQSDWREIREKGAASYFFTCNKPREAVTSAVQDYIKWGETRCRTAIRGSRGGGKICSQAFTCQEREKWKSKFRGWYDLGGVRKTPIMAVYQSQYRTRFFYCQTPVVTYHAVVTYQPKFEISDEQNKALLAYLNSSFVRLYVEARGRATALGLIALEITQAREMPMPDVRRMKKPSVAALAQAFDHLEESARKVGGADTLKKLEKLEVEFEKLDDVVAGALGLPPTMAQKCRVLADRMMQRRLERAGEVSPDLLRPAEGEEEMGLRRPRTRPSGQGGGQDTRLDDWSNQ